VLAELQQQMVAGAWRVLHMHCSLMSVMACIAFATAAIAKVCKLSSLVHQSA